jgi:hypothetical protein
VDKPAKDFLDLGNKPPHTQRPNRFLAGHALAQWSLSGRDHVAAAAGGVGRQPCEYPMPKDRAAARRFGETSGHRGWLKFGKPLNAPRRTSRVDASPSTCCSVLCLPWNRASSVRRCHAVDRCCMCARLITMRLCLSLELVPGLVALDQPSIAASAAYPAPHH